jgi:hypothetical protein
VPSSRRAWGLSIALALGVALLPLAGGPRAVGAVDARPDFDGDGTADLAAGAAGEGGGAGGVFVFYGAAASTSGRPQYFTQETPGVGGVGAPGDAFGVALAAGDFDGDGFDDLAIGVPGDDIAGQGDAGAVNVLYGSNVGLTAAGSEWWHQDRVGIAGKPLAGDVFGTALAAGDFDGDGRAELAAGAPGESVGGRRGAGSVTVLRGCSCGLTGSGSTLFTEDAPGLQTDPAADDNFGFALAVGRFGGDGVDDLAIGVPGATVAGHPAAGGVHVLAGSLAGLTGSGSQFWHEGIIGAADGPDDFDFLGWSIGAGDLNRDGVDDLAAGAPGEFGNNAAFAGAVFVVRADGGLLGSASSQIVQQETSGVAGSSGPNQEFGHAVLVAPVRIDGGGSPVDALVVGVPFEHVGTAKEAGLVHVLPSSGSGVTGTNSQTITLATTGVPGTPTTGGWFGITLGAIDTDGDGIAELVVGSPGEDVAGKLAAGALTRFGDAGSKPSATGAVHWTEDTAGISGTPGATDFFASALTA